jgi:hypothetical protein
MVQKELLTTDSRGLQYSVIDRMDYELQAPVSNNRCLQLMVFNKVTIEKTFY